ncbi:hypothetical protein JHK82_028206 [Glycine max]|nr:hypothetical protein JHK85_028871 [Glycine max]KAG5004190.1 hypothetical protein JHK86_028329 [Glycine max]KAG5127371.1 hypothetical protein JHK82_028206 [Glycine max]KAG5151985.1 hypothetical protein JHK84_028457 [Glycine max]KHN16064.1 hypothetical protein glysoja_012040 [Glycine soja]
MSLRAHALVQPQGFGLLRRSHVNVTCHYPISKELELSKAMSASSPSHPSTSSSQSTSTAKSTARTSSPPSLIGSIATPSAYCSYPSPTRSPPSLSMPSLIIKLRKLTLPSAQVLLPFRNGSVRHKN